MLPDDELCLCFHVSWRKVINYVRINQIRRASQAAECQSAGTGCGWCRQAIERIVSTMNQQTPPDADEIEKWLVEQYPASANYRRQRSEYIQAGKGTPPTSKSGKFDEDESTED